MTEPRAPDRDQLEAALAQRIAGAGLARYNPTGTYTPTGLPVILFGQIGDKPDGAIHINTYNEDYSRDDGTPDLYVQLRFRTPGQDKRTTNALAHQVFLLLNFTDEVSNQVWSGLPVLNCRRIITGPIAPDANGRYTRPDSYRITVNPTTP